jgi:hypothetical protein
MSGDPRACYLPVGSTGPRGGELFDSTRLSAAEWYPDGQHGGVVSALVTRAVERLPSLAPMEIARVTVELFRVIPVTRLEVVVEPVREGKRIQTSEVRVYGADTELARGLIQRLRVEELGMPPEYHDPVGMPPGPEGLETVPFREVVPFPDTGQVTFGRRAVEVRQARGSFAEPGPATVWFRFDVPLVEGEPMSPSQRAVLASDFSNGLSRLADGDRWLFMNSDLSVNLARPPVGEWVALDGESIWHGGGRGVATSHLFDRAGPIGRATQTLFLDRGPATRADRRRPTAGG